MGEAEASSKWTTIRPWIPPSPLSLVVREITSVSVTFALSAVIGEDDEDDEDEDEEAQQDSEDTKSSPVSRALADGLSVEVDGSTWRRVLIRVEEEAVIIIYGLLPGRQYDIILALMRGDGRYSTKVVTERKHLRIALQISINDIAEENASPSSSSSSIAPSPPPPPPLTLEDRLNQLQQTLSLLHSDRDSLSQTLKSTRKESQKADALLRSEIDVLKRASEKHGALEHRGKQKVLALQESVKRAQMASEQMEEELDAVNESLPVLATEREQKEKEYRALKAEWDKMQKAKAKERERLEAMKSEITTLNNKLDKLNAKKDKLENTTIPDLEKQMDADLDMDLDMDFDPVTPHFASSPPRSSLTHRSTSTLSSLAPPFEPGRPLARPSWPPALS